MQTFEQWMRKVDVELLRLQFVDSMDLPDIDYHDLYDEGRSPLTAAKAAIRNAKSG